jgi:uncharacterized membrane protein
MQIIITIIGAAYIFFIPGFFLTFVFFKPGTIDWLERFIFSFALSLAVMPLAVFYSNIFGLPINHATVLFQSTIILFITGIILLIQMVKKKV